MEKYVNGTGVGLLSMATADLLALILITTQNLLLSMPPDANQVVSVVVCKVFYYLFNLLRVMYRILFALLKIFHFPFM